MKGHVAVAVLAITVGGAAVGLAAPGDLDPSFGTGGIVTTTLGTTADRPRAVLVEPDGKIVVAGETIVGFPYDTFVVRYLPGGALDPTFATGGILRMQHPYDDFTYAIVREPDGRLVFAGSSHGPMGGDFSVFRLLPDGTFDPNFGVGGKVTTNLGGADVAIAMKRQDDGKLVVGGRTGTGGGIHDFALVRYLPDGTVDTSFGSGGVSTVHVGTAQSSGHGIAILPDGKILLAGYTYLGNYDFALLRFDADGWLDPTFGAGGVVTTDYNAKQNQAWAMARQADGKIVLGGYVTTGSPPNLLQTFAMARYLADGALDTSFGSGGFALTPPASIVGQAHSMVLQPDGKFVLSGSSAWPPRITLARFLPSGALDTGFGSGGIATTFIADGTYYPLVARHDDGKLIVASHVDRTSGTAGDYDIVVARYLGTRCGDGNLEPGEQCDDGNTQGGDCCTAACQIDAAGAACTNDGNPCTRDVCNGGTPACEHPAGNPGAVCRTSAGPCDMVDVCDGVAPSCPPDNFQPSIVTCRESAGACDLPESCTGTGPACPADAKSTAVCRPAAGACDVAEACNGMSNTWPADALVSGGTVCRSSAGECDPAEACSGASPACPADAFTASGTPCTGDGSACTADVCDGSGACTHPAGNAGTVCRPAAGACDVAEACDGVAGSCPADALVSGGTVCRAAAGACDLAEQCDGASSGCPTDALVAGGTQCRAAAGVCDLAEACTGTGVACPADAKGTQVCRDAAGPCDVVESCDGVADDCPADALQGATVTCRAAAGECDLPEQCSGSTASCPADAKSTAVCRPTAGACDVLEACDGVANACPTDVLVSAGTVCRPAAGPCDAAEACAGAGASCPADAVLPDNDGDALCDAIDPCTNIGGGRTLGGTNPIPKIILNRINTDTVPNNDHLTWTGAFVLPASARFSDLNPQANGARVVLRNRFAVSELDVTLPGGVYGGAGTRGWKLTNLGKTWTYTDTTSNPIGDIVTVNLYDKNTQLPNRVEIRVVGDDGTYPVVAGDEPIDGVLTIGGPAQAAAGLCGETAFVPADCFYNLSGNQLTCRQ